MKLCAAMASRHAVRLAALATTAFCGLAQASQPGAPIEVLSPGSMLQFALGLGAVLGLILAAGWVMKRTAVGKSAPGMIKVVAGAAVGQRERVVIVDVGDVRMVLGVAPGRVTTLHTMPLAEARKHDTEQAGAAAELKAWLQGNQETRRAN
jgi:flagellar protein FliO/FliZ